MGEQQHGRNELGPAVRVVLFLVGVSVDQASAYCLLVLVPRAADRVGLAEGGRRALGLRLDVPARSWEAQ